MGDQIDRDTNCHQSLPKPQTNQPLTFIVSSAFPHPCFFVELQMEMSEAGFLAFPREIKSEKLPKLALLIFFACFSRLTSRPKSDFGLDICKPSKHLDLLKSAQLYSIYSGCISCCTIKRRQKYLSAGGICLWGNFPGTKYTWLSVIKEEVWWGLSSSHPVSLEGKGSICRANPVCN